MTKAELPVLIGTDPLDAYRNHLNPELRADLTPAQAKRMAEYRFALGHITSGNTLVSAVGQLEAQFGLSQGTAYRRVQETFQIFGDFLKAEKSAKQVIYVEWLENIVTACFKDAANTPELSEKIAMLDMADKYMGKLIKLQELDKPTSVSKTRDKKTVTNIVFMTGPPPELPPEPNTIIDITPCQ